MHLKRLCLMLVVFSYLSSYVDENQIYTVEGDEVPYYELNDNAIAYNEAILIDGNSSAAQRLDAEFELIICYYEAQRYNNVRELCLNIISRNNIQHRHARYYLGELHFHGRGVEQNYGIARQYYDDFLRYDLDIDMPGPCSYQLLIQNRIREIDNI